MSRVLLGYILLFLSVLTLDQVTKWHSEKAFLADYDKEHSEVYQANHELVFGLGHTPTERQVAVERREKALAENLSSSAEQPDTSTDSENALLANQPIADVSKNWLEFNVTYLRNHGAVWGVFSDLPDFWRLALFYSVTVIAVSGVFYLFRKTPEGNKIYRTALMFVLAGAIGNFVDRLLLQYVIDWVHFQWRIFGWEYSFPVFNVADISIDVGLGLMIIDMFRSQPAESPSEVENLEGALGHDKLSTSAPLNSAPLNSAPLNSAPLNSAPLKESTQPSAAT